MTDSKHSKSRTGADPESAAEKRADKFGERTVGRGMDSPDSTEAVLDAKTGEPDPRATQKPRGGDSHKKQD
ncbi:MAG: hypothetical protein ABI311_00180 [Gemmatimonadaceae bacterium]